MTRLELAKKRAKELEKTQSNVATNENTQLTSNVSNDTTKSSKRLELAKQRTTELENAYKKAQEQQQAWNEYVEENGTDKINEKYQNYIQGVNQKIAPKLSQTSGMQELASKRTAVTASEIKEASDELNAYKAKRRY